MASNSLNKLLGKRALARPTPSTEWPLASQMVGIELELEGLGTTATRNMQYRLEGLWVTHTDGSLRNGVEFVLQVPLMGKELSQAISEFFAGGLTFETGSARASTHIHLNMLQEEDTLEVLRNMSAFYYGIEDALYALISDSRKWAVYASPLSNNFPYEIAMLFSEQLDVDTWIRHLANTRKTEINNGRHYGYNLKAMGKYGTVEFRHFPSVTSENELRDWVNLCMEIKKVAVTLDEQGMTTKQYFDTVDKFDQLPQLMPIWGQRLLDVLDREDALSKVEALYELLPIAQRFNGAYDAFFSHSLFKDGDKVGPKKERKSRVEVDDTITLRVNTVGTRGEVGGVIRGGTLRGGDVFTGFGETFPPQRLTPQQEDAQRQQIRRAMQDMQNQLAATHRMRGTGTPPPARMPNHRTTTEALVQAARPPTAPLRDWVRWVEQDDMTWGNAQQPAQPDPQEQP